MSLTNNATFAAIVTIVLPWLLSKLDGMSWGWVPNWATSLSQWLSQPQTFSLPNWLLVFLLPYLAFKIGGGIYRKVASAGEGDRVTLPSFLQYTEDSVKGLTWRWKWANSGAGYEPVNFQPICPKCGYHLAFRESWYSSVPNELFCERCEFSQAEGAGFTDLHNSVKRHINFTLEEKKRQKGTGG